MTLGDRIAHATDRELSNAVRILVGIMPAPMSQAEWNQAAATAEAVRRIVAGANKIIPLTPYRGDPGDEDQESPPLAFIPQGLPNTGDFDANGFHFTLNNKLVSRREWEEAFRDPSST